MNNNEFDEEVQSLIDLDSGGVGDEQAQHGLSPIVPELTGLADIEGGRDEGEAAKKSAAVGGLAYEIASNAEARTNASSLFASEFSRAAIAAESSLPTIVEQNVEGVSEPSTVISNANDPAPSHDLPKGPGYTPVKPQGTPFEGSSSVGAAPTTPDTKLALDAPDNGHVNNSDIDYDDLPAITESSLSDSPNQESTEGSDSSGDSSDFIAETSKDSGATAADNKDSDAPVKDETIHVDAAKSAASIAETVAAPEKKAADWLTEGAEKTAQEKANSDDILPINPVDDAKSFAGNTASAAAEDLLGADEGDFDWLAEDIKEFDNPLTGQQELAQDITEHLDPDNVEVSVSKDGIEDAALSLGTGGAADADGMSGEYTDFGSNDPESDLASGFGGDSDLDSLADSRPPSYSDDDISDSGSESSNEDDGTALGAMKNGLSPNPAKSAPTKMKLGVAAIAAMSIGIAMFSGVGASVVGGIGASNNNAARSAAAFTGNCSSGNATGTGDAVNVSANGGVSQSQSSGDAHERARYIYSLLLGVGMSPHVAAGVLGNIQVETAGTFSPQIDNPNDVGLESFGIVQWRAGRRSAVEGYMQAAGVNPNASGFKQEIGGNFRPLDDEIKKALAAQVAYLAHENATGEAGAWAKVSSMGSATEVADAFDQYWERSDGGARMQRKANANALYNEFANGGPAADPTAQKILESQGGGGNGSASNGGATSATAASGSAGCSTGGSSDGASTTAGNGTVSKAAVGTCSVTTKTEPAKKEDTPPSNGNQPQQSGAAQQSGGNAGVPNNPGATSAQPPAGQGNSGDGTTRNARRGRYQDWDPAVVGASNLNTGIGDASSCNGTYATTGSGSLSAAQLNGIINSAMSVQGSPYVWGAAGPNSFDCSGLVVWAFEQNGLSAPGGRTADNQGDGSATVATGPLTANLDKAQPGDLLFWDYENDGKWDHVGFYIGNGQMVHAPQPGSVVKVVQVYDAGAAMKIGRA